MAVTPPVNRGLSEMGAFLRGRRSLLTPECAGIPITRRRRTPGLRREEVSELAGISPDWYTRIELGTGAVPSASTLLAIARALQLSAVDTQYLFELAGLSMPKPPPSTVEPHPVILENMIGVLDPREAAASVTDVFGTPRCWNASADAMYHWSSSTDAYHRNAIVALLTDPSYRDHVGSDFDAVARDAIGLFRRAFTTHEPTPLARRIWEFASHHPLFQARWNEYTVSQIFAPSGPLVRHVPEVGALLVDVVEFQSVSHPDLYLRVFTPHDEVTRTRFHRLATTGTASRFRAGDD